MKKLLRLILVGSLAAGSATAAEETWSNWSRRLYEEFNQLSTIKLPGRPLGIIVPANPRQDILQMSALGYQALADTNFSTLILFIPAPDDYQLDGMAMAQKEVFETSVGVFNMDYQIRDVLRDETRGIQTDVDLFRNGVPPILLQQLAILRQLRPKSASTIQILPIYVKFSNPNDQAKDIAPFIVNQLKELGADEDVMFCIVSDLGRGLTDEDLMKSDAVRLKAVRALNPEAILEEAAKEPDASLRPNNDTLLLGLLTLRWLGADHAQIFSYACNHQLLLTKDKRKHASYMSAGIASRPPLPGKVPHVKQEKMIEKFDELFRGDLLSLARQTMVSTVDQAAAKPPSLTQKEASRRWPVYVSVFDPDGKLVGQAGSHLAVGPLEESVRKFAFEATREAQTNGLTKAALSSYVVEVSIPYGFEYMKAPDSLIPLLNGVVVHHKHKSSARHPEAWRLYPDPHELLGVISNELGLKPWSYATSEATMESFRVFSFNEKEPFQDLGAATRKKKKKKGAADEEEIFDGDDAGSGGSSGGSMFGF